MKKLILILLLGGFALTSCQKDDLSSVLETEAVEGRGKSENSKTEEGEASHEEHSENCGCEENEGCETAFGRFCDCADNNSCFSDFGFSRWGWSVKLNEYGEKSFNLFAGAGQCDLNKGTRVGEVKVTYSEDGSVSYHDFDMLSGFDVKEFHFYAGDNPVPLMGNGKETVAPGQYYNEGDTDGQKGVYVIVHAVVCGDYED